LVSIFNFLAYTPLHSTEKINIVGNIFFSFQDSIYVEILPLLLSISDSDWNEDTYMDTWEEIEQRKGYHQ
jgi:hypothetical protein